MLKDGRVHAELDDNSRVVLSMTARRGSRRPRAQSFADFDTALPHRDAAEGEVVSRLLMSLDGLIAKLG